MSDDPPIAGTHEWTTPDRARAEALAGALAEYGFPLVLAGPWQPTGWVVTAFDPGPYPGGLTGHAAMDDTQRRADGLARQHGGRAKGGARCAPAMLPFLERELPVRRENPGARPPAGPPPARPVPPTADVPSVPDRLPAGVDVLAGLSDVAWARLEHAHGPADDVPDLLRALARPAPQWTAVLTELLADDLLHQGSCYSATPAALPFLARLAARGALPAALRLELYLWLVTAAGQWAASLVRDAPRAGDEGVAPVAAAWTQDAHLALATELPMLVEGWADEPPAVRYASACLVALYPQPPELPADEVAGLARRYADTQPGWCLQLAGALLADDDAEALRTGRAIAGWAHGLDPARLDIVGVPTRVIATHVLSTAAPYALGSPG